MGPVVVIWCHLKHNVLSKARTSFEAYCIIIPIIWFISQRHHMTCFQWQRMLSSCSCLVIILHQIEWRNLKRSEHFKWWTKLISSILAWFMLWMRRFLQWLKPITRHPQTQLMVWGNMEKYFIIWGWWIWWRIIFTYRSHGEMRIQLEYGAQLSFKFAHMMRLLLWHADCKDCQVCPCI